MLDPRFFALTEPLSLAELVEGLDVDLEPKFSDEIIKAPSGLSSAKPFEICFFQDKKRTADLTNCKATACFVTETLAPLVAENHIIPIISATPRAHFARACVRLVQPALNDEVPYFSSTANIHSTAIIKAGAHIADGVEIGAYSVVGAGVSIGKNSTISSHVSLSHCDIGAECRIKSGAVIGGAGFGVAKDENGLIDLPHFGRVVIGDRVSIGSQTCIDRGQLGDTILSDDVKLDNLVQIAHNVHIGQGTLIAGQVGISGSCIIGRNVQMGGNVGLADHLTIGDNAVIAARAGVMHDIPASEMWSGIPAMPIRDHMRMINATRKLVKKPKREVK